MTLADFVSDNDRDWVQLPNGLIIQHFKFSHSSTGTTTVNLVKEMTTTNYAIFVGYNSSSDMGISIRVAGGWSLTTTTFSTRGMISSTYGAASYLVIGY